MKCDDYNSLLNRKKLEIEYHPYVTVSEKKYDNYMFLFDDFFSFQYEKSKIYSLMRETRQFSKIRIQNEQELSLF